MVWDGTACQSRPSIRGLAAASRVIVITVRRAYEELGRAGVIATRQGKGSVVAERSDLHTALMHEDLQRQLEGVLACAARLGLTLPELPRLLDKAAEPDAGRAANPTNRTGARKGGGKGQRGSVRLEVGSRLSLKKQNYIIFSPGVN